MEPRKYLFIDSLRGLAILLVLLVHNLYLGTGRAFFSPSVREVLDAGQFGVQLFFMVSAYTLMASYYSRRNEPMPTLNFFVRRFFRIAPMYYLAIGYFTVQGFLGFDFFSTGRAQEPLPLGRLLANLFFLNGFNPYWINNYVPGGWSVGVEMTFYAALPLLCRVVKSATGAAWLLAASVLFRVLMELLLHRTFFNTNEFLYYYFPNQLPVFSLGILAFFVVRDGFSAVSPKMLIVIGALAVFLNFATVGPHFTLSVGFFFLLVALARHPFRWLANRPLAQIGQVSFSLYLVHFAVMHWLDVYRLNELVTAEGGATAWLNFALRFGLLFLLSFAVSFCCYRFVERPFQRWGRRIIQRLNRRFSPAPLPAAGGFSAAPPSPAAAGVFRPNLPPLRPPSTGRERRHSSTFPVAVREPEQRQRFR